jgi:hypothetical protein
LEIADDFLGLTDALVEVYQHLYVAWVEQRTDKTSDGETDDAVPFGWHFVHLHATKGADKEELGVGFYFAYGIGDGDGGKNVTSSATAAYENFHCNLSIYCKWFLKMSC